MTRRTQPTSWPADDRMRIILASVLALAFCVLTVATGAQLLGASADRKPPVDSVQSVAIADLTPGTCVLRFAWRDAVLPEYSVVPCSVPHGAELVARIDASESFETYPGDSIAGSFAREVCSTVERYRVNLRDRLGDEYPNAVMREVRPSSTSWGTGSPFVYCFLANTDGKQLEGGYYTDDTFE